MKARVYTSLLVIACIFIFSCKQANQAETAAEAPVAEEKPAVMEIDPKTDPLVVGKEFATVFSDTLNVQLYEMVMEPNDSIGLHIHPDHSVYVLEGGTMMLYINCEEAVEMELPTGAGFVSGPLTDCAKNIGDTSIRLLINEIYRPRE